MASPMQAVSGQQEPSLPQSSGAPVTGIAGPPMASPPPMQSTSHYSWPPAPAYSPPGPYSDWSRPTAASSQSVSAIHQFSGNRSPRGTAITGHHLSGQSQSRQQVLPQSPHPNGPLAQQTNNGYPSSPHRNIGSTHQMQNGVFGSYAATRLPPQHLTNGGPPPRAAEHPFSQNNHPSFHSPFAVNHGSPPAPRETLPVNRDSANHVNGGRASDGRVNGGASASPSLQNLLS